MPRWHFERHVRTVEFLIGLYYFYYICVGHLRGNCSSTSSIFFGNVARSKIFALNLKWITILIRKNISWLCTWMCIVTIFWYFCNNMCTWVGGVTCGKIFFRSHWNKVYENIGIFFSYGGVPALSNPRVLLVKVVAYVACSSVIFAVRGARVRWLSN